MGRLQRANAGAAHYPANHSIPSGPAAEIANRI